MTTHRIRAYVLLLIVAVVWGIAGPIIKFTLGAIEPLPFLTYRFGLSAAVAILAIIIDGAHIPRSKETFLRILLYGFLVSTVALGLLFSGLNKTTVLDMTLITAVGPLLIALAGVALLNEHVTKRERIGMGIAFSGSLITILSPLINDGIDLTKLSGNFLIILYLLANTVSVIMMKKLVRKDIRPITLANYSFIVGFLTMMPITLLTYGGGNLIQSIKGLTLPYHLAIVYMALISGNLGYTLWARAQKTIEVGEAAVFAYLYPIFSAPLAVLWLKESITPTFIVGAALIASGVIIAEYKKQRPIA